MSRLAMYDRRPEIWIDIREISSGLGHSSLQLTEKHYAQNLQEKLLDEINGMITRGVSLD